MGFALPKRVEQSEVGGHSYDMPCTRHLPWLAVEQPWSALAGSNEYRNHSSPFVGAPFLVLQAVFCQEEHSLVVEP